MNEKQMVAESPVEIIRRAVQYHIQGLHTSMPASVVSYSAGRARVQPLLRRKWADGTETALPIVPNVPVSWPQTAAARLKFKLAAGDTGYIICAERSIDEWLLSGDVVTPQQARTHSLSDAVFVPALVPYGAVVDSGHDAELVAGSSALELDDGDATLRAGAAAVTLEGGKVALGAGAVEVLDLLSQLLGALGASVTTTPGQPIANAAIYDAMRTQLESIRGSL